MAVHAPSRRLLENVPLHFVANRLSGAGGRSPDASLNLTSMIDFLTVVVIFLLMSFSASGDIGRGSVELPEAQQTRSLERAPIVTVTAGVMALDIGGATRRITDVPSLMRDSGESGNLRIDALVEGLETLRRNWTVLHPDVPFPGTVVLEVDRAIDFRVLKRVLYSCAQAGYANMSFLVRRAAS